MNPNERGLIGLNSDRQTPAGPLQSNDVIRKGTGTKNEDKRQPFIIVKTGEIWFAPPGRSGFSVTVTTFVFIWLRRHDRHDGWWTNSAVQWSTFIHSNCIGHWTFSDGQIRWAFRVGADERYLLTISQTSRVPKVDWRRLGFTGQCVFVHKKPGICYGKPPTLKLLREWSRRQETE